MTTTGSKNGLNGQGDKSNADPTLHVVKNKRKNLKNKKHFAVADKKYSVSKRHIAEKATYRKKKNKKAYRNLFSGKLMAAKSGDALKENFTDETIRRPFGPVANLGKTLFFPTETDSCGITQTDSVPKKNKKKLPEEDEKTETEGDKSGMYVGAFYGPSYFASFGNHSIMQNERGYSGKGSIGSAYGVFIRFKIGEKLALGIGAGKTLYKATTNISERNGNNSFFYFQQIDIAATFNADDINAYFGNDRDVKVSHSISYLEVPISVSYNLSDKIVGIDLTGGMSVSKLMDNKLSVSSATRRPLNIGKLNSLLETTASFNGGLQFYYNLGKRWRIEVTPSLRYYLKATENSTDFKPYSFSVQGGMSYKL